MKSEIGRVTWESSEKSMITVKNRKESKFKAKIAPKKHKIAEKGLKVGRKGG